MQPELTYQTAHRQISKARCLAGVLAVQWKAEGGPELTVTERDGELYWDGKPLVECGSAS